MKHTYTQITCVRCYNRRESYSSFFSNIEYHIENEKQNILFVNDYWENEKFKKKDRHGHQNLPA